MYAEKAENVMVNGKCWFEKLDDKSWLLIALAVRRAYEFCFQIITYNKCNIVDACCLWN
jgi:hypothetical protein